MTGVIGLVLAAIPPAWFGVLIPPPVPVVHYTDLAWEAAPGTDPSATFSIYKALAPCAAAAEFQRIAAEISSGPAGLVYRDYNVEAGQAACYYVTSVLGTQESGPSNKADAVTPVDVSIAVR